MNVNERISVSKAEHLLFFTFVADIVEGEPRIIRPEEISAVEWVSIKQANAYLTYHPGGVESLLGSGCSYRDESIDG